MPSVLIFIKKEIITAYDMLLKNVKNCNYILFSRKSNEINVFSQSIECQQTNLFEKFLEVNKNIRIK